MIPKMCGKDVNLTPQALTNRDEDETYLGGRLDQIASCGVFTHFSEASGAGYCQGQNTRLSEN